MSARMATSEKPKRLQLSRRKGFRLPPGAINVARPTRFGSPFIVGKHGTREECVRYFECLASGLLDIGVDAECFEAQKRFRASQPRLLEELMGHDLACWCAIDGKPCHADVLLRLSNA